MYDDVHREALHDWLDERIMAYDQLRAQDGPDADDLPDEFVRALRDEGEEEDVADELACEADDAARAERGEPDRDARA